MPGRVGTVRLLRARKPSLVGSSMATTESCVLAVALLVLTIAVVVSPGANSPAAGLATVVAPAESEAVTNGIMSPFLAACATWPVTIRSGRVLYGTIPLERFSEPAMGPENTC